MLFPVDHIVTCLEGCGFKLLEVVEREPYPDVEHQSRRAYALAAKPRSAERRYGHTEGKDG